MLKFFRKIRQRLLQQGKLSKYLTYAVGEILLVVIGILIALQINNWNEWRKERDQEVVVLEELAANLQDNLTALVEKQKGLEELEQASTVLYEALDTKQADTSLNKSVFQAALLNGHDDYTHRSGYEFLKNIGYDILLDRDLRREVVHYFERTRNEYLQKLDWGDKMHPHEDPFVMEHFIGYRNEAGATLPGLIPRDINFLLHNNYFYGLADTAKRQRSFYRFTVRQMIKDTQRVLDMVKAALAEKISN